VTAAAASTSSETAPGAAGDRLTFVRRGDVPAARKGVYALRLSRPGEAPRRLSSTLARETATNGTRVAYTGRSTVVVRRISAPTEGAFVFGGQDAPRSLVLSRYTAGWLLDGGVVRQTERFAGSGGPFSDVDVREAERTLPTSTVAIALIGGRVALYLDAAGVKTVSPAIL